MEPGSIKIAHGGFGFAEKTIAKTGSAKFIPTGQSQCKLLWEAEVGYSAVFRFLREKVLSQRIFP